MSRRAKSARLALAATTAALLGGGISRHGASCPCRYCAAPVVADPKARQLIPVVK